MKVKVIRNFTDKYDKNVKYKVNDEIEINKKRYEEILAIGKLVEEIKEEVIEAEEIEETKETKSTKKGKKENGK